MFRQCLIGWLCLVGVLVVSASDPKIESMSERLSLKDFLGGIESHARPRLTNWEILTIALPVARVMSTQNTVQVSMDNIMVETNENGFVIMAEVESNGDEAVAEKQIPLVQFGSILRYLVESKLTVTDANQSQRKSTRLFRWTTNQSAREKLLSIAFDCIDSRSLKSRLSSVWKSKLNFEFVITKLMLIESELPEKDLKSIVSDWVICPPHGFNTENKLGSGSYGDVYRCKWGDQFVAVKYFKPEYPDKYVAERFITNLISSTEIKRDHLCLPLHPLSTDSYPGPDDSMLIIYPLFEGGDLAKFISEHEMSPREVIKVGISIVDALVELEKIGVSHEDLRPPNLLLRTSPSGRVCSACLEDFDMASVRPLDESSDLFSLKLVLNAALSKCKGTECDRLRRKFDKIFAFGKPRGEVLTSLKNLKAKLTTGDKDNS